MLSRTESVLSSPHLCSKDVRLSVLVRVLPGGTWVVRQRSGHGRVGVEKAKNVAWGREEGGVRA